MTGKRMKSVHEKVDRQKLYPVDEAFGLLKELSSVKFDETVDIFR